MGEWRRLHFILSQSSCEDRDAGPPRPLLPFSAARFLCSWPNRQADFPNLCSDFRVLTAPVLRTIECALSDFLAGGLRRGRSLGHTLGGQWRGRPAQSSALAFLDLRQEAGLSDSVSIGRRAQGNLSCCCCRKEAHRKQYMFSSLIPFLSFVVFLFSFPF